MKNSYNLELLFRSEMLSCTKDGIMRQHTAGLITRRYNTFLQQCTPMESVARLFIHNDCQGSLGCCSCLAGHVVGFPCGGGGAY